MVSVHFASSFALAVLATASASPATMYPRIHAGVHRTLRKEGAVNLIVTLKDSTEAVLESVQEAEFASRGDKITRLVDRLEAHSKESQAELNNALAQESASAAPLYKSATSFWISNQVYVEAATFKLVEKLSALSSIAEVREEQILSVYQPAVPTSSNDSASIGVLASAPQWGVAKIQAPDVWATGNTGRNVVVGSIDTGVRSTHNYLKNSFRSAYGWYDPITNSATPRDDVGHGTHTVGSIVGTDGVGVAPGAQWIACKACADGDAGCSEAALLSCAQFMTCPTDVAGNNKDCTKAPDVVTNSWGGGQGDTFFQASVNAWLTAGIIPIFAIGNNGPACSTAESPGDSSTVIAVGSTESNDGLSSFSNKGPTIRGLLKPDISAPGGSIRSAWYTSDTAFATLSGTSMATPHVTGVVALMLSARPGLNYAQVKSALIGTTDKSTLKPTNMACGNTPDGKFPNNHYGYGRVNALNAVARVAGTTPVPTTVAPTPITKPPATDRCTGLSEALCAEYLCEWSAATSTCRSWL